ncbi:MAG: signal peptidase I [Termitinemataceae bacterium]|nr:MAG: signal peptidase I [Termitinemataceae bacterium]
MFNKWLKYSYADQKTQNMRTRSTLLSALIFLAVYILITNYLFSFKVLENSSMEPGLKKGERYVVFSFNLQKSLPNAIPLSHLPLNRGNIVLIKNYEIEKQNVFSAVAERVIRFFTIGQAGLSGGNRRLFLKRVIALPGDTVSMTNYVMRVQPAGDYAYTEFELARVDYNVNIPEVPALWDYSLPFSGNMEKFVLEKDQCFVMSDDRSNTNDSRTWGAIDTDLILGKVIFRYWPLNKIGTL